MFIIILDHCDNIIDFPSLFRFIIADFFITDMYKILPLLTSGYFKRLVSFNHVIESVKSKVVVDNFLLSLIFLIGVFEIDVDDLLNLMR